MDRYSFLCVYVYNRVCNRGNDIQMKKDILVFIVIVIWAACAVSATIDNLRLKDEIRILKSDGQVHLVYPHKYRRTDIIGKRHADE